MLNYRPKLPKRTILAATLIALVLQGCIGLVPSPFRPSPGPSKEPQLYDLAEAFDIVCRNYRLGPDDQLSVNFQTEWTIPAGSYKLDTLDVVDIEFILDPELDRQVVIRPDGMITLPGIGDVKAVGLSPEDLARRIEEKLRLANILKNGDMDPKFKAYKMVTVSVSQFYQKIKRLVESLTTLTNGQQVQVTVKPDGTIDLPLLKDRILAAGHTVNDVERTVNKLYRSGELKNVVASIALNTARSRKVYVLGEVRLPGAYEIRQPITPLQAIALAGGAQSDTADLTSVILISKNIYGKPIGRRLDVKRLLDIGDMSSEILVKPYDVIYVPKTYVRDLRVFMEQYFLTVADVANFFKTLSDINTNSGS
ncbi:MAG TPA: polysaccharide biosynthesis/export family protein [Desulfomonilaceae bacterium]|nr:polysaccharide biosynthesis/export family protein [Desulfomonilaceae bacterium]